MYFKKNWGSMTEKEPSIGRVDSPRPAVNEAAKTSEQQRRKRAVPVRHRPFSALRRSPVPTLFSFCVPTLHINDERNGDIVLNALIAEFIAPGAEHHMTGKVLETQDFYEFSLCSSTIASTCPVLGNISTASAVWTL